VVHPAESPLKTKMSSLAYVQQIGPCHDLDNHKHPHLCNTTVSYYDNACRNAGLFSTAYRCAVICNDNWSHLFSRFGGKRLHLSNVDYVACNMTAARQQASREEIYAPPTMACRDWTNRQKASSVVVSGHIINQASTRISTCPGSNSEVIVRTYRHTDTPVRLLCVDH